MSSDVRKSISSVDTSPYSRTLKYSVDEKLAIISHAKTHGNRAAGREFNVAESSIREWRKNEQKLINSKNNSTSTQASGMIGNNNNKTQNKNGTIPLSLCKPADGVFGRRVPDDIFKQYAQLIMNANPLIQLQQLQQLQQLHHHYQQSASSLPAATSDSTSNSVVSTPSSVSSSSSPPPPSPPVTSGSGRRKLRCPQKITTTDDSVS